MVAGLGAGAGVGAGAVLRQRHASGPVSVQDSHRSPASVTCRCTSRATRTRRMRAILTLRSAGGCEGFTGRIAERESLYILPAFWYGKRPVRVGQNTDIKAIL